MKRKVCPSSSRPLGRARVVPALVCCLLLVGCLGQVTRDADGGGGRVLGGGGLPESSGARALGEEGLSNPSVRAGVLHSATGCALRYTRYRSTQPSNGDLVVLGHGFLRDQAQMVDLARALAAAGVTTVTLDFCNGRLWDGGHFLNGLDMVRVADGLGARRVVYVGFSAGALAALVAGRNDPRTLGVVALDLVDAQGLGVRMAKGLGRPLVGLVGEPSSCNARNNGLAVYAANDQARVTRIAGASHCDFESPTDWLCRMLCQGADASADGRRRSIIEQVTIEVARLTDTPSPPLS